MNDTDDSDTRKTVVTIHQSFQELGGVRHSMPTQELFIHTSNALLVLTIAHLRKDGVALATLLVLRLTRPDDPKKGRRDNGYDIDTSITSAPKGLFR